MAETTYHGACNCKSVAIQATLDLATGGAFKCNCTYCRRLRTWAIGIEPAKFKVVKGESLLKEYGQGVRRQFCGTCGVHMFAHAEIEGQPFIGIVLAVLDDLDPRALANAPTQYFDGLHDRFDREPEVKDHL